MVHINDLNYNYLGLCIDRSGVTVKTGDTYTPVRSKDCLFCTCGLNNTVDSCKSPVCDSTVDCRKDLASRKCCCIKGMLPVISSS